MKAAREIDRFLSDPVGRHCVGATYLVWASSPTLCGLTAWGRSGMQEVQEMARLFDLGRHPAFLRGHDVLIDAAQVAAIDWGAFTTLTEHVKSRLREWGERIRRMAVIVPPGPVGFILGGLAPLLDPRFSIKFFSAPGEALAWLGRDDARAMVEELESLVDEARCTSPLLRALHAYLVASLRGAGVQAAARALKMAPRSLQRELRKSGTSFNAELQRARVHAASGLLAHSDEKIEAIARRVGCSSSSHLSTLFRKAMGETPAQFRTRHEPSQG